jgi:hypothetical protein
MSKFLLNLLLQIFKSLGKFKNPIFISEIPFFLIFGLASSLIFQPSRGPTPPLVRFSRLSDSVACPIRPLVRFGRRLLHLSDSTVSSLSLTGGSTLSLSLGSSPPSDNAQAHRAATAPRPPSAAQLHASGATEPLPPHLYFPSLKSPLKPSPIFNGVKAINTGIKLPRHPSPALPGPL